MTATPKIFPLGDGALTIDLGNAISDELNARAISLAESIRAKPFDGLIETVPAYSSVGVFYDVIKVRLAYPEFPTAFEAVRELVSIVLQQDRESDDVARRLVKIPVDFGVDAALDLDVVAEHGGMEPAEVIELFCSRTYRVFMLGFLPGFAYMGTVDDRIAVPRRSSPRKSVPKGSIGIAGNQTGIYPLESPGGWQIIGRTSVEIFTPNTDSPCLLRPGDEVRFLDAVQA
jgi:inhibitor of KinA